MSARDHTLEYLERCQRFWKHDAGRLAKWIAALRAGKRPTLAKV